MAATGDSGGERRQRVAWVADRLCGSASGSSVKGDAGAHMARTARRLGLASGTAPEVVAGELAGLLDSLLWEELVPLLGDHGRRVCSARRPACGQCGLAPCCPRVGVPDDG